MRARTELTPLGGADDKIFPPTYGVATGAETKYATEDRRTSAGVVASVVLDSVSSQANRQELALLAAKNRGDIKFPVVSVDFTDTSLVDLGSVTSLEAPHRVFDAIFRDSMLDDRLFRLSEIGQKITEATSANATALLHWAPTALLFGAWDSTGPKGGRGSKFERAITSEVVATGITRGVKTSSRIDPLGIEKKAGTIFANKNEDEGWTMNGADAVRDKKGNPQPYASGDTTKEQGRPSQINHGNVTPSIESSAGGVTADRIVGTSVISFAQLRRVGFRVSIDGTIFSEKQQAAANLAGQTLLAALGLAAISIANEDGYDLRSRCVLVPTDLPGFELVGRTTSQIAKFALEPTTALEIFAEAARDAEKAGVGMSANDIVLTPVERLVDLVEKSRNLHPAELAESAD